MRLTVPLTGTILEYDPEIAQLDGQGIKGDPDDPVRLIDIDLGNVSWRLVSIDYENETAEIEVTPGEFESDETGKMDDWGEPEHESRPTTKAEKDKSLDDVKKLVKDKTKDELYAMSKSPRLKKP